MHVVKTKSFLSFSVYKELDDDEEENDEDEDIICADDGAVSWLQSIGLDKSKFPSLEPHKIKMYP